MELFRASMGSFVCVKCGRTGVCQTLNYYQKVNFNEQTDCLSRITLLMEVLCLPGKFPSFPNS